MDLQTHKWAHKLANRMASRWAFRNHLRGLFFIALLYFCGCSSVPSDWTQETLFETSPQSTKLKMLWEKKVVGVIADVAIARETGHILVSELSHPERGGDARIHWWTPEGKEVRSPFSEVEHVRSLALSPRGDFAFILTASGTLNAYKNSGERVFTLTDLPCRPMVLSETILGCVYDDEITPGTRIDFIDLKSGKKIRTFSHSQELLEYKTAFEKELLLLGLSDGKLILYQFGTGKILGEKSVDGEILSVAYGPSLINPSSQGEIGVLTLKREKGRKLDVFSAADLRFQRSLNVPQALEQLESMQPGEWILFGNSPQGQSLWKVGGHPLSIRWQKKSPRYADFSQPMQVSSDGVWIGLEEVVSTRRRNRLVLVDSDGKSRTSFFFEPHEGAYYYAYAYHQKSRQLMAVDENGGIRMLRLK